MHVTQALIEKIFHLARSFQSKVLFALQIMDHTFQITWRYVRRTWVHSLLCFYLIQQVLRRTLLRALSRYVEAHVKDRNWQDDKVREFKFCFPCRSWATHWQHISNNSIEVREVVISVLLFLV